MTILKCETLSRAITGFGTASRIRRALGALILMSPMALAGQPDVLPVPSQMPLKLKPFLVASGQRLQKPGKERITMTGTLSHYGGAGERSEPVRITLQPPLKMQLEKGGNSWNLDRSRLQPDALDDPQVAAAFQMLLEDSVEGFFTLQEGRIARRHLGSGFRLEGARESDSSMDVLLLAYEDVLRGKGPVNKSYWFDSGTKLLGVVAYTSPTGSVVHSVVEDWRDVGEEKFPFRIERWEDSRLAMRLVLEAVSFSPRAMDRGGE
jgi:hypothetical protein